MFHRLKFSSTTEKNRQKKEASSLFLQNGSALLEKLIAATNGRYDIPIRIFTAIDLEKATNNFDNAVYTARISSLHSGSWNQRQILVRRFYKSGSFPSDTVYDIYSGSVNDIVTTARMSKHKNVLRLIGCCLELEYPALVYEYAGLELLSFALEKGKNGKSLAWKSRLKIASEVANVIVYLHTAFQTPIIYRILNPSSIIIDQHGVAKLFDFSYSIALPPGKLQVQDDVIGVTGYIDLEYYCSGFVSQKADVYSFGVLLLVLLTGQEAICRDEEDDPVNVVNLAKNYMSRNQFKDIVDQKILQEIESSDQEQELHKFVDLALWCAHDKGKYRPEMIDVAKEIHRISKFFSTCQMQDAKFLSQN